MTCLIYTETFWRLYVLWCRGVITVEEMDYLSRSIK